MRKKLIKVLLASLLVITISGCNIETDKKDKDKFQIMTTLFPQYDFSKEIVKDKGEVSLLIPPGVEAHSYEPTPQDIVKIRKADVFIYTSDYMEPWAKKMIDEISEEDLLVINLSENLELIDIEGHDDHDHDHEEIDAKDPHTWLDPIYAQQMVNNIANKLKIIDKDNAEYYENNANAYIKDLKQLDADFISMLEKTSKDTIIYGGHFAFGYFTKRYNLKHISPYVGFSPNAEPTPSRIVELIETLEESDAKVIYYEELVDPKVAEIISEQTGAKMLLLHGAHNISKAELNDEITYLEIMYDNLEKLKEGLGYEK